MTKLEEVSLGKDTMTGHWEIMGLNITEPFDTFWDGFPEEILTKSKNSQVVKSSAKQTSRIQVQLSLMTLALAKWKQGVDRLHLRRPCASDCGPRRHYST